MARCFAVAMSHAEGFSGIPRNFQTSSARQKASWTTSSANARLCTPKMRVSAATMRPDFVPEEMLVELNRARRHHILICMIGRTSTKPSFSKIGHPLESSAASARSLASTIV